MSERTFKYYDYRGPVDEGLVDIRVKRLEDGMVRVEIYEKLEANPFHVKILSSRSEVEPYVRNFADTWEALKNG